MTARFWLVVVGLAVVNGQLCDALGWPWWVAAVLGVPIGAAVGLVAANPDRAYRRETRARCRAMTDGESR